jgi:MSHA biogenesis protein MshG
VAIYEYSGRNLAGDLIQGQREADSAEILAGSLLETRITPIEIREVEESGEFTDRLKKFFGLGKPTLTDIILFSRQMYTLSKSGVPIIRSLSLIAESTRNEVFAETLREVGDDLESGRDFSGALARHPKIFGPLYVNIIRVGEETGRLEDALLRLHEYLDADKVTLEKIKSALFYPALVIGAIICAVIFLMAKVIPKFAAIFEKFNLELPLQTRIIIAISNFIADHWMLLTFVVVAAVAGIRAYLDTEKGRYNWHRYKLRIPRIGDIVLRATLARFTRAFAMSNSSGVPILQGLAVTAKAVDNDYVEARIRAMRNDIERGESITRAAIETGLFTPLVLQMLAVGEETGRIDEMMEEVADFYDREVAYDVANLTRIIEPALTVIMGLLVLILAMGIFLPMWDMVKITQR